MTVGRWRRTAVWGAACVALVAGLTVNTRLLAQVGAAPAPAPTGSTVTAPEKVPITVGRSTVLTTEFEITRLAITNPAIADATAVSPHEVLIDGKGPGTVSLIIWGPDRYRQYDVVVDQGTVAIEQQLHLLFPGEDIQVSASEEALVLHGRVSSNEVSLRAAEIAAAAAPKAKVINMFELPGGSASQQVMLQVRVAEVNRRAWTQAGLTLLADRREFLATGSTQQFGDLRHGTDASALTFGDTLNLLFFSRTQGLGGILKALTSTGGFETLAEPNLIAYNGQEASFLAGGEFPIPIVQGVSGGVTVQFKEFGVRLTFTPRIAGDTIRLKVKPEVSTLDFNNGITLSGFRIPALSTRRTAISMPASNVPPSLRPR